MGFALDIVVLLVLAASIARGWRRGLIFQIIRLALMIVAYFIARAIANGFDLQLAQALSIAPLLAGGLLFVGAFFVIVTISGLIVRGVTRDLKPPPGGLSELNRLFGAIVGAARGALFSYVVIAVLVIASRTSDLQIPWTSSFVGRYVAQNNALERGEIGALTKLVWLMTTRPPETVVSDTRFAPILELPDARALLRDAALVEALVAHDYITLLGNDALWAVLRNETVQRQLALFSWVE